VSGELPPEAACRRRSCTVRQAAPADCRWGCGCCLSFPIRHGQSVRLRWGGWRRSAFLFFGVALRAG